MNKYETLRAKLDKDGSGKMKCFGNSMTLILQSGSLLTFEKRDKYEIGNVVFCKVRDDVKFVKCNIQDAPNIASKYGITSIPLVILFKNDEPADSILGLARMPAYEALIEKNK